MMRRMSALLLILMLAASACSSGSGGETEVGTGGDDTASDESGESSGSTDPVDDGVPMAASSPIGAFFADGGGFEAAIAEYTIRVEEAIVICMANEGFEFARTTQAPNEIQEKANELTTRQWRTEYGYGISTSFDTIAQSQANDPNAEIMFSLSAAERELWIENLTGGDFAGQGNIGSKPLEEQGCIGEALIETGGQEAIEGMQTFGEAYEEGEEAIFDRREMVDAVDAWSRCMSEAGVPGFSAPDDPEQDIGEKFEEVIAPLQDALETLSPEEGQAMISGESLDIADLPDLDVDALRELQADEVTLALVDLDCYEAEVEATYEPLRDDFENGLIQEYASELDALKNIGS